jgi:hypothetical protein
MVRRHPASAPTVNQLFAGFDERLAKLRLTA